ncbi:MAG: hypothetical protein VB017_04365 [Endomicrobiaceae bacterium]|jgi:hypothetical protein|nr:hypothetical protein [Endomicrobiaceae bacterium]
MVSKNKSISQTLYRAVCFFVIFSSVATVIFAFLSKDKRKISVDRLRKAYEGLSPQDYQ